MVERFHRRLKEALIALGTEEPEKWFWKLPMALLAIRTTVKPDIGASPSDLVYGEGLAVPGEALPRVPSSDAEQSRRREATLANLRLEVARLQPTETSAHRRPLVHIPADLQTCTHVFVRRGGIQSSLSSPYTGPYRVVARNDANFKVAVPGRGNETVAIARVKPAYSSIDDAEDAAPPSPPPPGRRPRRPQRRDPEDSSAEQEAPAPPPVPRRRQQPPEDPLREIRAYGRRLAQQQPPPPDLRQQQQPVEEPEEPPQPPLSPASSPAAPTAPVARQRTQHPTPEPRRRLFSDRAPRRNHPPSRPAVRVPMEAFAPPQPPPAPRQAENVSTSSHAPQTTSTRRYFSDAGRTGFSRRRPDISALVDAVHRHLGTPSTPSSLTRTQ